MQHHPQQPYRPTEQRFGLRERTTIAGKTCGRYRNMCAALYLAASVQGSVFAEGDHVVHALAHGLGPRQRGHDASVTDDLQTNTSIGQHKRILSKHIGQGLPHDARL